MTNSLVKGLVLRSRPYKENDVILTLFTSEYGVKPVICRGVRSQRRRPAVYCQPFCYSEFNLFIGRSMPVVDDAEVLEQFYGLRSDVVKVSLAQYLADICAQVPENVPDGQTLRLMLNSLFLIAGEKADLSLIKLVFELKYAELHGFSPAGTECASCGKPASKWVFGEGFLCRECAEDKGVTLSRSMILAVNQITEGEGMAPYRVRISEEELAYLGGLTSQYMCHQLGFVPKSLEYYRKILDPGSLQPM